MNSRKYTNRRYLDALENKVLVFDGAMGTNLQEMDLTAGQFGGENINGCNDYLVITYPEAVEKVHRSFLDVGVDVIETDTFRANRITMREYGLRERVIEINRDGRPAGAAPGGRVYRSERTARFVAGSIGPSGKLPSANDPELSNVTFDELVEVFREQAIGLIARRGGLAADRDLPGHPGSQGGHHRHPEGLRRDRRMAADPGAGHAGHHRAHAARHRHRRRADHPGGPAASTSSG